jgi:hypothetical protein
MGACNRPTVPLQAILGAYTVLRRSRAQFNPITVQHRQIRCHALQYLRHIRDVMKELHDGTFLNMPR